MIEVSDIKRELDKIEQMALDKDEKVKAKAKAGFQSLRSKVLNDISKTGDHRVRGLLRALFDFQSKKLV